MAYNITTIQNTSSALIYTASASDEAVNVFLTNTSTANILTCDLLLNSSVIFSGISLDIKGSNTNSFSKDFPIPANSTLTITITSTSDIIMAYVYGKVF